MNRWLILTGDYPPQLGDVSDYTRQIACGLAEAGDLVHVRQPRCSGCGETWRDTRQA